MWKILKRRCMYRGECPLMTGKFHHKKQICSIHCYPPVTEVKQRADNQNGELSNIYLSDVNHKHLFLFLFRRNVKRVCRKALAVHRCYTNHKHTERRIWSGTLPLAKGQNLTLLYKSTIYLSDVNHKRLFLFLLRRNAKRVCRKALAV